MKIAHIVSTYPPYHGGMGNVAAAMHEELLKRGHDSLVITPQYHPVPQQNAIIRVRPWFRFRNSAFIPQIGKYLAGRDIIHLHYPFYGGAEAVAWYKQRHPEAKVVVTYHMDTVGKGGLAAFFSLYKKFVQSNILRVVDVITASSRDYADHSQMRGLDIEELPFGVGPEFQPDLAKKSAGQSIHGLFVGGLDKAHYFKGLAVLIDAMSLTKQLLHLTVVGSGDMRSIYEHQAKKLGLADRIEFVGALSKPDLIKAYQKADFTVLPSVDRSEAFGLVLLESMACQTPVIATDLPGVRTLARHQQTGLIVPPNDRQALAQAMTALSQDKAMREQYGSQARQLIETRYRWPKIIDQLEAIYRTL
jgi:glycosyltransferase involved in cell wall biosynthesis